MVSSGELVRNLRKYETLEEALQDTDFTESGYSQNWLLNVLKFKEVVEFADDFDVTFLENLFVTFWNVPSYAEESVTACWKSFDDEAKADLANGFDDLDVNDPEEIDLMMNAYTRILLNDKDFDGVVKTTRQRQYSSRNGYYYYSWRRWGWRWCQVKAWFNYNTGGYKGYTGSVRLSSLSR